MTKQKSIFSALFLTAHLAAASLTADHCAGNCGDNKVCGKATLSAAYIHIDLLDNGDTVDKMDIPAVRGDVCWAIWKGVVVKPTITWGKNDKEYFTAGLGLGHLLPLTKNIIVTPTVGFTYTNLSTTTAIPFLGLYNLTQRFRSYAPYVALEGTWTFRPTWRLIGLIQYAWTRNRTTIEKYYKDKEWSTGFNYALLLEHDLNDKWSLDAGGGYTNSMSHEKRGIRGYGFKVGLSRWF